MCPTPKRSQGQKTSFARKHIDNQHPALLAATKNQVTSCYETFDSGEMDGVLRIPENALQPFGVRLGLTMISNPSNHCLLRGVSFLMPAMADFHEFDRIQSPVPGSQT